MSGRRGFDREQSKRDFPYVSHFYDGTTNNIDITNDVFHTDKDGWKVFEPSLREKGLKYKYTHSTLDPCYFCREGESKSDSVISGVGKDAETVVNEKGGKQSKVQYRFDVLDPKAMFAMCKVLKEGYDKYGDDSNWRKIPVNEHLNHLLIHVYAYLAGDETDEHLSHALCRAMFALAVDLQ